MLPPVELYNALNKAQEKNLFAELQAVYNKLPETTCNNCASCCSWGSPPAFFIEYLNMYRYVRDKMKDSWSSLLIKCAEYFYLELVDINQKCPFIGEDNKCLIYEVRPLSCRFYGLLAKKDFEKGERSLKFIADKLWEEYQIKVPDEIANGELPWCENVKNTTGKYIPKNILAGIVGQVGKLDAYFFPENLVDQEGTSLPYPVHLMNTVLGDGARARKIKIMKEFSDHGTKKMLEPIVQKASNFQF
ncbi:Fe-S-cluster containining protein [Desulfohalotomaculum tongense]|uniref:YkgJ family cysteine cluster protein n=1 Tax=Desulforadius tongensis TaxID=1216062 RepID=UPI00195BD7F4|nr:YkgJ family cysteine cluster protein [Desulforadius tongensis]MBM7854033.1 Fe-S-cluster containining protein [Desulforadius tongensis]